MIAQDGYPPIFVKPVAGRYEWCVLVIIGRKTMGHFVCNRLASSDKAARQAARRAWDKLMAMGAEMNRGDMV